MVLVFFLSHQGTSDGQPARQMHTSQKESQVAARGKLHNINSVFQNMTKLKRSVFAKEVQLTLFSRR